jgi:LytS/YehU family sensor histidine kinase
MVFGSLSILSIVAAVVIDSLAFFIPLQNAKSGELDFSLVSSVNVPLIIIASAAGVALCVIFQIIARALRKKSA